ncbi:MAG: adenylyl-sulfate kinase [Bacteroidia bacterium]|nr:adenylyl-sulfate kinase [Bacteroidia bacterium]
MAENIFKQHHQINKEKRGEKLNQKPCILWFTGLSGSGKSTLADGVEQELAKQGYATYILDGDNIRHGLNVDLDFSEKGRVENIRRIGEVAKLMVDAGLIVLTAFISPYQSDRKQVRALVEDGEFIEIFVNCALEICEKRDVKGLYKKARKGEIENFTGISSPYEPPGSPEIEIVTDTLTIEESVKKLIEYIVPKVSK